MADVSKSIQKYIEECIRLSKTDISQSAKSREWIIDKIKNKIAEKKSDPVLYSDEPFLKFGSYFKGTKVQNVDEYDILVVIDSNTGIFSVGGNKIADGLGTANPNHKYNQKFKKEDDSGVSPTKMLNWLKSIIEEVVEPYNGQAPERNGQAITAEIKNSQIKIDFVPAGIFRRDSDNRIFYNIPDGTKDNGWIRTSPQLDMEFLNKIAEKRINFKNIIRICKRIKDTYNFKVSSFAIETAVVSYANNNSWYQNLYTDTKGALGYIEALFRSGKIEDSFEPNNNLIQGVDNLSWYADRIATIISSIDKFSKLSEQDKCDDNILNLFENK